MALSMEWEKSKFGVLISLQEAYSMRGTSFRERLRTWCPGAAISRLKPSVVPSCLKHWF